MLCNISDVFSTCFGRSDQKTYNIGGRRIQTLKKIGEGGFSVVYLAKDRDSGEEFAVKKLLVQDPAQKRVNIFLNVRRIFCSDMNILSNGIYHLLFFTYFSNFLG